MPVTGILGHESAITILEQAGRKRFEGFERVEPDPWEVGVPGWREREEIRQQLGLNTVHLVVPGQNERKGSVNTAYHVWSNGLPEGSLIKREDGLIVSSPEFCLLQMATRLTDVQLARLAMQFCGTYSPDAYAVDGFVKRDPLTSVEGVEHYLAGARKQQGCKKLSSALRWVADNARSPRETSLEMLMVMPTRRGGYHFPKPKMNVEPDGISEEVRRILGQEHCVADLWWEEFLLIMEYLGRYRHDEKFGTDLSRVNALATMGILVELVAKEQLEDATQMDMIAHRAAKKIGRRIRPEHWPRLKNTQSLIDELVAPLPTDPRRK